MVRQDPLGQTARAGYRFWTPRLFVHLHTFRSCALCLMRGLRNADPLSGRQWRKLFLHRKVYFAACRLSCLVPCSPRRGRHPSRRQLQGTKTTTDAKSAY